MDRQNSCPLWKYFAAASALAGMGLVFGCRDSKGSVTSPSEVVTIPPSLELRPAKATFYVAESPDQALYELTVYFGKRGLLAYYFRDSDAMRMYTLPTEDREGPFEFRRVSYAVKVVLYGPKPECAWIEVRWLLQARGFEDPEWRGIEDPLNYRPPMFSPLSALFGGRDCRVQ